MKTGNLAPSNAPSCSDVFATTLRRLKGTICVIEKGTRVKVSGQCEINHDCRIDLLEQDNPSRIWNCIAGVPMKYLQFESDHGMRDGPCVLEYQDTTWNKWPTRSGWSCRGCKHFDGDFVGRNYCAHPALLEAYDSKQYLGGNMCHRWKLLVSPDQCPVLTERGANWPEQPPLDLVDRGPSHLIHPDDMERMFRIPQPVPYWERED